MVALSATRPDKFWKIHGLNLDFAMPHRCYYTVLLHDFLLLWLRIAAMEPNSPQFQDENRRLSVENARRGVLDRPYAIEPMGLANKIPE
jgi:hypothetical protein